MNIQTKTKIHPTITHEPSALRSIAFRRQRIVNQAITQGLLHPETAPLTCFIDETILRENINSLHDAFRDIPDILHAFAVKAGSLPVLLNTIREFGMGAEVASEGEFAMARLAGFDSTGMVFDSPAKTNRELQLALDAGVQINIDNFQELERIAQLIPDNGYPGAIGFRINPQLGTGNIEAMSTAGAHSKFGVGLQDPSARTRLIDAYEQYPWLTSLHVHSGSQGISTRMMVQGVSDIISLADEINGLVRKRQVTTIDIGGGLPVDFDSDFSGTGFPEYAEALRQGAPRLFSGHFRVVTEFGRSILAKAGFMAAFVEYTKRRGGRQIAITHAGAHVAARTVLMPEDWPVRVEAFTPEGHPKDNQLVVQDVAGPCCFAGDLVAKERAMPELVPGDIVVIPDTGAYYASIPFMYNSIPMPAVFTTKEGEPDGQLVFKTIRQRQTIQELLHAAGASFSHDVETRNPSVMHTTAIS